MRALQSGTMVPLQDRDALMKPQCWSASILVQQIYQLTDICICTVETPDELVDQIHALADKSNFPTNEEKKLQW